MNQMKHGLYVAFDGLDGSGKGTVLEKVKQRYPKIMYTREPGGTDVAEKIRSLILCEQMSSVTEFFLFLAQRSDMRSSFVQKYIENGVHVISDRADSSTFAFQIKGRKCFNLETLFWETRTFLPPHPNLYVIFDLPAEVASERSSQRALSGGDSNRIDQESIDFHRRVRDGFLEFGKHVPCVYIDATKKPEEVAHDVFEVLDSFFAQ
ncbi:MAG: hypothetical protein RLZZ308_566 [Candidatus Parcubacteria bacterium]|jgi:dTMP kinase